MISRRLGCGGFAMLEVMVSVLVLSFGILALMGLFSMAGKAETESYGRVQALVLLNDMADRMAANRRVASCYAAISDGGGPGYVGSGTGTWSACTAGTLDEQSRANADITAWAALLAGSAETSGGNKVGAVIGARGCVRTAVAGTPTTPAEYVVSVAWQGLSDTAAPADTCGTGLFGSEAQRRVVSTLVSVPNL